LPTNRKIAFSDGSWILLRMIHMNCATDISSPWSNNIKVTMTTWHQSTLQLTRYNLRMEIDHVCNENIIYADPTTQKKYKNLAS
jgi:hypothetical protein